MKEKSLIHSPVLYNYTISLFLKLCFIESLIKSLFLKNMKWDFST